MGRHGQEVNSLGQEPDEEGPPEENPAPRMRRRLSPGCSEARPLQMKLRVADKVLALQMEAALQNAQIDLAMAAMGIAQNLKKEENVIVAQGSGSKSVQTGSGTSGTPGTPCGEPKPCGLECVPRHRKGNANCRSLECVAHDGRVLASAG